MTEETVRIYRDGNLICCLIGTNLQEGIAGFGYTVAEALHELAKAVDKEKRYEQRFSYKNNEI